MYRPAEESTAWLGQPEIFSRTRKGWPGSRVYNEGKDCATSFHPRPTGVSIVRLTQVVGKQGEARESVPAAQDKARMKAPLYMTVRDRRLCILQQVDGSPHADVE